jgi:hypothetical protein
VPLATSVCTMAKRLAALFLFCVLTLAGLPAVESAPLCAKLMPECCCIEESSQTDLLQVSFDAQANAEALNQQQSDADLKNVFEKPSNSGHDDCCCEVSEATPPGDLVALTTVVPLDLAANDVRSMRKLEFPFYKTFSTGTSAHTRRPLHLATNKVYLLKRSFLI